jgi:hypothetical protein
MGQLKRMTLYAIMTVHVYVPAPSKRVLSSKLTCTFPISFIS